MRVVVITVKSFIPKTLDAVQPLPAGPRSLDSKTGRCDVHPEPDHRLAHLVSLGSLLITPTAPSNQQSRLDGDQQGTGEPIGFLFKGAIPVAKAEVVKGRRRRMQEQPVGEFVGHVACLAARDVEVVVDYLARVTT